MNPKLGAEERMLKRWYMILIKQNLSWKLLVAIGKVRENIYENNLREKDQWACI